MYITLTSSPFGGFSRMPEHARLVPRPSSALQQGTAHTYLLFAFSPYQPNVIWTAGRRKVLRQGENRELI